MTREEIKDKIIDKQDELIIHLDELAFDTMPDKSLWKKRKELFKELADLKKQLEEYKDIKNQDYQDGYKAALEKFGLD